MILHYYEKGIKTNPVVIFIHGSASDASVWLGELNLVSSQGYYCLALDLRGHGETRLKEQPKEHVKIDIDSHLHDVKETLEYLQILPERKAIIVTHSFGGIVAINLAEEYPKFVEKLIMVALPPKLVWPMRDFLKALLGKPLDFIQAHLDFFQATILKNRYKSSILTNADVLKEIFKHVKNWNGFRKITRLKQKIYFAAGRFDIVAPAVLVYRLHLSKYNSEFELFKWSGHALMEDEPEKFRNWLINCINKKENEKPENLAESSKTTSG